MSIAALREFFLWRTVVNHSILWVLLLFVIFTKHQLIRLHGRWFKLSLVEFDATHYRGMAYDKIGILLLNIATFIALSCIA